ncbi:AT-rich interactive domain-containing protein 5B-like [Acanthaster planci]|uniref:AT-rich interactive domain-containing protein 5B-like n=1 Tax=Acanthaster planci TaxID=133434 RepID=A0A8B7YYB6_ACAPL|nr:AT-rich interactive domain-containing protein 5B-like [Acanthaster planci]
MDKFRPQWLGAPAGQHGPNTFYKGCKFFKDGKWRILSMGEFFFLKTSETEPLCIAELQLLWQDDKAENGDGLMLSSSKLYFLPEDTPEGRTIHHGEDEVVGVSGKAILRLEDLIDWVCTDVRWTRGCRTICEKDLKKADGGGDAGNKHMALFAQNSGLNISEINREKKIMGYDDDGRDKVIILNYPSYCRYCATLKRMEHAPDQWISHTIMRCLGAFTVPHRNTRILFCKDEFEHPTLGYNEKLCDHLAPNMKGRPRKKKLSIRSNSNEDLVGDSSNGVTEHAEVNYGEVGAYHLSKLERKKLRGKYQTKIVNGKVKTEVKRIRPKDEATFLAGLFKFMKDRNSPIERVPNLGFKQIDLYLFYTMGQKFGGYEAITARRLWKKLYDVLGGSVGSTSAATCTRRHYERLILPYERYLNKQEHKPLPGPPPAKPTKGISILAKPGSKHKEKDPAKHHHHHHHKKKDKHAKDRPKGMTKAEETWIQDQQKQAAATAAVGGLIHETILTPVPVQPVSSGASQPQTAHHETASSDVSTSTLASVVLNASSATSILPVATIPPLPQLTPAPSGVASSGSPPLPIVSAEMMIVCQDQPGSSSLKMKLKVKKSRHKDGKRPKVLKDQLRELEEQRALQQKEAHNQLYANSLQLNSPPVARKKTMSIADILNQKAKMQAKQKATQAANIEKTAPSSVENTPLPAVSSAGNPVLPVLSTSAMPFPAQPIMVKTEEGVPVGPLIFTLPQMLPPGATPALSSAPGGSVKIEDTAGSTGLTSTTAPSLTLGSNMATVLHVGQPLQVMQMPTPSSTLRDSAALESSQSSASTSTTDSVLLTTSANSAYLSCPSDVGIVSCAPTSLTAVVNPIRATSELPGAGCTLTSSKVATSARPSVIQHTQHVQAQASEQGMTSMPYRNAVQPSDLILRNLSLGKAAAAATATTSAPVIGQKRSDLPKDAVVVTPRFVNPFMAYIPMPVMVGGSKAEPKSEEPRAETSKESGCKRRRTESGKENISGRPLSPHGFSVDRTGKVTPLLAHSTFPGPVPFQDEPCDLSMPKRKREEDEAPMLQGETGAYTSRHKTSRKPKEFVKDRTRWQEETGAKRQREDAAVSSSVSSLHKVKMTPNPRGSIMQGVINPSALSPSSYSSKSSEHRDAPSRHNTNSNETATSPHPPPPPPAFPYLPHPSVQGTATADKPPKSQFVFPELGPHLPAVMGYPPRFFPPQLMPGPLLARPDLLPTSLPPGMQLNPEQLMRRDMFFPPHFPFQMRPPFLSSSSPLVRDSQQSYMNQS